MAIPIPAPVQNTQPMRMGKDETVGAAHAAKASSDGSSAALQAQLLQELQAFMAQQEQKQEAAAKQNMNPDTSSS